MPEGVLQLQETSFLSNSQNSLGGFSEYSIQRKNRGACDACMSRIPYATMIATIMCTLGVIVFCWTLFKGASLSMLMFEQVFKVRLYWIDAIQMIFVIIGACMGALGCMILTVGCLATGATRRKVYRAWRSRVGGRIGCAIFMVVTYILQIAWILMFAFLVIITFVFTIFWNMCDNPRVKELRDCIEFQQFYFLFPKGTLQEHMQVCGENDIKLFCGDYVDKAELMFILATAATVLIILSLIHYLMCLSANYAHIRDHEKFQELQDLHYLTDPDMGGSKDRF
ncbi:proteolipid protein DM beta isoform X1 [Photinus pyralis]|uniref:Neuronal membrane glycoprotein M6-a n=1 Tax=Photinus pyralis TaxID=7054 RepID=A0A1Y1M9A6_PHOPY|nr:proteolipid protein DM beta isoform X1 [Photinus pyralis]